MIPVSFICNFHLFLLKQLLLSGARSQAVDRFAFSYFTSPFLGDHKQQLTTFLSCFFIPAFSLSVFSLLFLSPASFPHYDLVQITSPPWAQYPYLYNEGTALVSSFLILRFHDDLTISILFSLTPNNARIVVIMGWEPDSFLLAEEASQYILLLTSHAYSKMSLNLSMIQQLKHKCLIQEESPFPDKGCLMSFSFDQCLCLTSCYVL